MKQDRVCPICDKNHISTHNKCDGCRKKSHVKERVCPVCTKRHISKVNKCADCKREADRTDRICNKCGEEFYGHTKQCHTCRNMANYGEKTCITCGKIHTYYLSECHRCRRLKSLKQWVCPVCDKEHTNTRAICNSCSHAKKRAEIYEMIFEHIGKRACEFCDEDRHIQILDFHHDNPYEKKFNISQCMAHTIEEVLAEAEKCTLTCANCHRLLHAGVISLEDKNAPE